MKESSALIKLTKSEIEMVINALQLTEDVANHFDIENMFTHKIKNDFIKIRKDIIEGESNNETQNKVEQKAQGNQRPCVICDD
tara:strand:- start:202 stop:450 length:249 start_codon:yes stop_codon:yes gene_type:complete